MSERQAPKKCSCGTGISKRHGNFVYYGCGSVATKPDKSNQAIFSTCPKQARKRAKFDMTKLLINGSLQIDSGAKLMWVSKRK
ncbi:MAG: hypothetical protein V3V81_06085 [Candidatus Bathyarchaeia archaeon]